MDIDRKSKKGKKALFLSLNESLLINHIKKEIGVGGTMRQMILIMSLKSFHSFFAKIVLNAIFRHINKKKKYPRLSHSS